MNKNKKPAWFVNPSLLELLSRRKTSLNEWIAENNIRTENDLTIKCSSMKVLAPSWTVVEEIINTLSNGQNNQTDTISPEPAQENYSSVARDEAANEKRKQKIKKYQPSLNIEDLIKVVNVDEDFEKNSVE